LGGDSGLIPFQSDHIKLELIFPLVPFVSLGLELLPSGDIVGCESVYVSFVL
jgi:hypothetical protein